MNQFYDPYQECPSKVIHGCIECPLWDLCHREEKENRETEK